MTINALPPALIMILGGLLLPLFKGRTRQALLLLLPVVSFHQPAADSGRQSLDLPVSKRPTRARARR